MFFLILVLALTSRNDWEPLSHAPVAIFSQTPQSCRAVARQTRNSKKVPGSLNSNHQNICMEPSQKPEHQA